MDNLSNHVSTYVDDVEDEVETAVVNALNDAAGAGTVTLDDVASTTVNAEHEIDFAEIGSGDPGIDNETKNIRTFGHLFV